MKKNKFTEAGAVASLKQKGAEFNAIDRVISIPKGTTKLGNGSWAKVDFLECHCRYAVLRK